MKNIKRLFALLIATLLLAVSAAPALANSPAYEGVQGDSNYEIVERLYFENSDAFLEGNDEITYEIAFATTNPKPLDEKGGDTINPHCYNGHPTISDTGSKVTFTAATPRLGSGSGDYSRYMQQSFYIDFSGVTFYEPGIYRYNLTKTRTITSDGSAAILPGDVTNNRATDYILVYVASDSNTATLLTPEYVHANNKTDTAAATVIGKAFNDKLKTHHTDLSIQKTVAGSMGSKNQYFEFTISLSGNVKTQVDAEGKPVDGAAFPQYKVASTTLEMKTPITANNDEEHDNETLLGLSQKQKLDSAGNPELDDDNNPIMENYITLDKDGNYTGKVWLRHGQGLLIDDLPAGMTYTVTETSATGYTTTINDGNTSANSTTGKIPNIDDKDENTTVRAQFTNTKDEPATPTGINLHTAAPLFGILLAGLLIGIVVFSKRRENL